MPHLLHCVQEDKVSCLFILFVCCLLFVFLYFCFVPHCLPCVQEDKVSFGLFLVCLLLFFVVCLFVCLFVFLSCICCMQSGNLCNLRIPRLRTQSTQSGDCA